MLACPGVIKKIQTEDEEQKGKNLRPHGRITELNQIAGQYQRQKRKYRSRFLSDGCCIDKTDRRHPQRALQKLQPACAENLINGEKDDTSQPFMVNSDGLCRGIGKDILVGKP